MENIIFKNLLDKINTSTKNINQYFDNIDSYNTNIYDILLKLPKYNIIIYLLIIFIIYNFINRFHIRLNEILSFIICFLLIYFLINKDYTQFIKYTQEKKIELEFLHKLMFNGEKWQTVTDSNIIMTPLQSSNKSYLYLNPALVDLYYNIRMYVQYNISAYTMSIIHSNNVIAFDYESQIGINRKYYNYQTAIVEKEKALNELNTVIYNLPSTIVDYEKFNSTIQTLHSLLNQHLINMDTLFKNINKTKEINNSSMPDNFYDETFLIKANDMESKEYISTYNVY